MTSAGFQQPPPAQQHDDIQDWTTRLKSAAAQPATVTGPHTGTQKWQAAFFGCFNPIDTCCITCCCPCVTFGKTHHRLRKDPNLNGYSPINTSCIGWWASSYFCLSWVPQILQRRDIQERNSLEGDFVTDCLKVWCCACCDLIQQEKEAEYHALHGNGLNNMENKQPGLKNDMELPPGNVTPADV
ncbi:hypothetical protein BP5796_09770 [Coleophoma crateriformis]|uniref:PLAC8 family protein n=1 Tax=Coleophoma crateriformis TaxID=565419 RepID=A0A3D8QZD4_9HELO|nr:hypothetical protein BP5796_09770 [Coleophoma crateriformis]